MNGGSLLTAHYEPLRPLYFDASAGAAGDMILGALVDAGAPVAGIAAALARLGLPVELTTTKVTRAGIAATKVEVVVAEQQPHRRFVDVRQIIAASALDEADKARSIAVFERLAAAEAKVHGAAAEEVEFHEVGSLDAIADVVGCVVALRLLGVGPVFVSPLPVGSGTVGTRHGVIPLPGPAVLELLASAHAPIAAAPDAAYETLTPTAAAIFVTLGTFARPPMRLVAVGTGAGTRDPAERPNVLRVWIGEVDEVRSLRRTMALLETNIDDMNPEILAYTRDVLLASGAADAWLTPIQMKKGRAATKLSVLCTEDVLDALAAIVLHETTTLGLRVQRVDRIEAEREILAFESSLGPAAVKVKRLDGRVVGVAPEFEVCREIASRTGLVLVEVYRIVEAEARASLAEQP